MPVSASISAKNVSVNFSIDEFKAAFALTKEGGFAHSVEKTKGELYVKDGKLCSANIHGGKGTVESDVENSSLRRALYNALKEGDVSEEFQDRVYSELFVNTNRSLDRKLVKGLLVEYDKEMDRIRNQTMEMKDVAKTEKKALASRTVKVAKKSAQMADFRSLGNQFKNAAKEVKSFCSLYGEQLQDRFTRALDFLFKLQGQLHDISQEALNQNGGNVESAMQKIKAAISALKNDHPNSYANLKILHSLCANRIKNLTMISSSGASVGITPKGIELLKRILKEDNSWPDVLANEREQNKNPDTPTEDVDGEYILDDDGDHVSAQDFIADCKSQLLPALELLKSLDPSWNPPRAEGNVQQT